jgi:hypothetical protein
LVGAAAAAAAAYFFDDTVLERRFWRQLADGIVRWALLWIRTLAAERWRLHAEARALDAIASPLAGTRSQLAAQSLSQLTGTQ